MCSAALQGAANAHTDLSLIVCNTTCRTKDRVDPDYITVFGSSAGAVSAVAVGLFSEPRYKVRCACAACVCCVCRVCCVAGAVVTQ